MNLGTCCVCRGTDNVRHIRNLNGRCPILGRGWGCPACNLPPHGAVAVVCAACDSQLEAGVAALVEFCTGHPTRDGRTPIGDLQGSYDHDQSKHLGYAGGV